MATTQFDTASVWSQLSSELRRFICRRVSDDHTADDLLQETFVRIHRGLPALESDDRLTAWVYRIARNVLTDHYRGGSSEPQHLEDNQDVPSRPCRPRGFESTGKWLGEIISTLPDSYRDAVHLSEIDEFTHQEVADRLGLTLSATKSRVQRGRAALAAALQQCCKFHVDPRGNLMSCDPLPHRTVCLDCEDELIGEL